MLKLTQPVNKEELAHVTSSILDLAIFEIMSGNLDMCVASLKSLHSDLLEIAGIDPAQSVNTLFKLKE